MKLRSRKVKLLFILLFFTAFTALALELFTSHGLFKKDDAEKESGNISFPDTLIKGKPPVSDTVFTNLLQQADILLKSNKFESCLAELERARKIRPADKVVGVKIVQVRGIISENNKKRSDFQASLVSGDAAFQKKDYLNAKAYYQLALNLIPTDSLGREKLKKTMELIRSQKASNTLFDVAVANADRLFAAGDYERARAEYENASHIIPSEQYPKQKINEIVKIMVDQQMQEGLYGEAIRNADQLYTDRNWQPALLEYQNASKIRPQEKYPKDRIAELLPLIAAQRSKDEAYIKLIASADQLLSGQSYIAARKDYESASKIKPDQIYPKNKIAGIDALLVKIGRTQKDYEQYISLADSFYIDKNFTGARDYYTLASGVKPGENYPKEMLEKVKPMIAGQEANLSAAARAKETEKKIAELALLRKLEDDYAAALKKGDSLLALTQYAEAKTAFTLAATLKPTESYPKEKLVVINTALADLAKQEAIDKENLAKHQALEKETLAKQQAIDKQYIAAITAADKLLVAKSYSEAKVRYNTALALKPGEVYPAGKITEIDKTLAELAKQKALDDEYGAALASGETLFKAKSYEQARAGYQKATVLKPEEALPKRRIASIDSIARSESDKQLAELARLKKLDEDYKAAVKQGDSLLAAKQYAEAKIAFTQASTLKPSEIYSKEKLAVINTAQVELEKRQAQEKENLARQQALEKENLAKQQALDKQYQDAVTEADKLLTGHSLGGAKAKYTAALTIKPAEAYPKAKIAEIDKIVTDSVQKQKALDQQYAGFLRNADQLLLSKTYSQAKSEYAKASELKPSEEYPKIKIGEIEKALADLAARKTRDSAYAVVIANADKLLAAKSFEQAKAEYQKAFEYKADDLYLKTKITEIDKTVADIAQQKATIESRYKASVARADQLLASKSYELAKTEYTAALGIKAGEQYPQDKIKEINTILAELKAKEEAYKASVAKADQMLLEKKWEEARTEYENALTIKPGEQYAKNKVEEINNKLMELQGRKKTFDDLVLKGDNSLGGKDYGKAREFFQQATGLFPEEAYPRERLKRVNSVIDSIYRANKGKYDIAIAEADKFYNGFEFDRAIDAYTNASVLLPMESYPQEMIARIHRTISENAISDVMNSAVTIRSNEEKRFPFTPVNIASRKDNFIYIKLRNLSGKPFSVLLRYGKDKQPSGGVVIRNLSIDGKVNERLISVREQDVWYRVDNDYISLYPQGGDIEVTFIQVSKAH